MALNSINFHLPVHICREILSYLPIKSLLRFRTVSKDWKSIIDNPDFASLHLSRYPNNCLESHLIVLENPTGDGKPRALSCSCATYKAEYNPHTSEFEIPIPDCIVSGRYSPLWPIILGDVNGLLLVQRYRYFGGDIYFREIFLWNPSIRKTLSIPPPPSPLDASQLFLGFDPSTNDYKVLNISPYYDESEQPAFFNIFSLKSRYWRQENFSPGGGKNCLSNSSGPRNVSLGGALVHWIVYDYYPYEGNLEFATFNMTSETFSFTLLPKLDRQMYDEPVLLTGFLVGFLVKCEDFVEIWVLKQDDCSWSRKYRLGISHLGFNTFHSLSYFTKVGAFICRFSDSEALNSSICFYEASMGAKMFVSDSHWFSFYTGAYKESLALLAKYNTDVKFDDMGYELFSFS